MGQAPDPASSSPAPPRPAPLPPPLLSSSPLFSAPPHASLLLPPFSPAPPPRRLLSGLSCSFLTPLLFLPISVFAAEFYFLVPSLCTLKLVLTSHHLKTSAVDLNSPLTRFPCLPQHSTRLTCEAEDKNEDRDSGIAGSGMSQSPLVWHYLWGEHSSSGPLGAVSRHDVHQDEPWR